MCGITNGEILMFKTFIDKIIDPAKSPFLRFEGLNFNLSLFNAHANNEKKRSGILNYCS
jgi:hypothetical protein